MARYNRNRKKKTNTSIFFLVPLILAILFGIGSTLFTLNFFRKHQDLQTFTTDDQLTIENTNPGSPPVEEQETDASGFATLPPVENNLESLNTQAPGSQPGLPDLLDSDGLVRQHLTQLSPGLAQWLSTDRVLRRYMLILNDFAQGIRVSKHMSFLRHDEPFTVLQGGNVLFFAPKSFRRYDSLTQAIQAIDPKAAVEIYLKFKPLLLQVFVEFGYPKDVTLESIIKKAAAEILAAPVIADPLIELVRPSLFYKFADPNLEALNPVQKQMIRMGPENTRIIQKKCREFLVELAKKT